MNHPGAHLTISVLAEQSHWDRARSSRESSSWIKEKRGRGSPGSAAPARRVWAPGEAPASRPWGPGPGGCWGRVYNKKKAAQKTRG